MRNLLIVILVVGVLVLAGWLKFSNTGGDPTIRVDTSEVQRDTEAIVQGGREVVESVRQDVNDNDSSVDD